MTVDRNGASHDPFTGQYDGGNVRHGDKDLEDDGGAIDLVAQGIPLRFKDDEDAAMRPPKLMTGTGDRILDRVENAPDPLLAQSTAGLRGQQGWHALTAPSLEKDERETRALLAGAARVEFGPNGAELYDADGRLVFREDPATLPLNRDVMRADRRVQEACRETFRASLDGYRDPERKRLIRAAHRYAGPYARRVAVDASPNLRYLPADTVARSLAHRRDREQSVRRLTELFYTDANAAAAVVRSGFPDDKATAMSFINKTSIQRYAKDVKDRKTGETHRRGEAVKGWYVGARGKHKGERIYGPLPNPKGAHIRSYLRMTRVAPTNGVPERRQAARMSRALASIRNPEAQARAFYQICYGRDALPDPRVDEAKRRAVENGGNARGMRELDAYTEGYGQGNAARVIAYHGALTREAAIAFCALQPGDNRKANTVYTSRKKGEDGKYREVTPARLNEMRNYLHSVYAFGKDDVDAYREQRAAR